MCWHWLSTDLALWYGFVYYVLKLLTKIFLSSVSSDYQLNNSLPFLYKGIHYTALYRHHSHCIASHHVRGQDLHILSTSIEYHHYKKHYSWRNSRMLSNHHQLNKNMKITFQVNIKEKINYFAKKFWSTY